MNLGLKYVIGPDGNRTLTIPDERRAAVIDFVAKNAAGTPDAMEAIVQEGHDILMRELDGLSEAQARHKPSPDDWSILELMAHVVTVKRVTGGLCQSLRAGRWPEGVGEEWEEEKAQDGVTIAKFETLAEARPAADAAHATLITFIRALDDSADVDKRFKHFLFGAMNCREWAIFQRIHDADHTPQIAATKASPNFPAA